MRRFHLFIVFIPVLLSLLALTGVALAALPSQEMPLNQTGYPREVNADNAGNLWVSDYLAAQLWWENATGNASKTYAVGGHPRDASPDNLGNVWWVDATRLYRLSLTDNITTSWSIPGSFYLTGVSINPAGLVWMSDSGSPNVYSFDPSDRDYLCTYVMTDTSSTVTYPFVTGTVVWLADTGTSSLVRLQTSTPKTWTVWSFPGVSSPNDVIVDANGDVWYTDSGSPAKIGRLTPSSNELRIYHISLGSDPSMLSAIDGKIWYTEWGVGTIGSINPLVAPPAPELLIPATAAASSSCSRLRNPGTGSVTPSNGSPAWSSLEYSTPYQQGGLTIYQLPTDSQPYGIGLTAQGNIIDSQRKVLGRFTYPTAVDLIDFVATSQLQGIQLSWSTSQENDLLGFNLYRSDDIDGERVKINPELIPALTPGQLGGNDYHYLDTPSDIGKTYYYWVEWVGIDGFEQVGPSSAMLYRYFFLPLAIH